jgi:hypothetical protein
MAPAMALFTFFDDEHAVADRESAATPQINRNPIPLLTIFISSRPSFLPEK